MVQLAEVSRATFEDFIDLYPRELEIKNSQQTKSRVIAWLDLSLSSNILECVVADKTFSNELGASYRVNQDLLQQFLNKNV